MKRRHALRHSLRKILTLGFCLLALSAPALCQSNWPTFSAGTADGGEFHSRALEGKVVVVTVWASWCSNCRKQLPVLSRFQRLYKDHDVQVVSFSFDREEATHQRYVQQERLCFPAIYARNGRGLTAVKTLQPRTGSLEAVPTLLIFDQKGRLVHRTVGFLNMSELESLVAPLLSN